MAGPRAHCSPIRARLLPGLLLGVLVLLPAMAAPAAAALPDIGLTPASGPVGTDVTVSGGSCKAG
jgi:hypothetical protein